MKCGQEGCNEDVAFSYDWPGLGLCYACCEHAAKATAISGAMGMPVRLTMHEEIPSVQELRRDLRLARAALDEWRALAESRQAQRDEARGQRDEARGQLAGIVEIIQHYTEGLSR